MYTVFDNMLGLVMDSVANYVTADGDQMIFKSGKKVFRFYHSQRCCEKVNIEDIAGDLKDLVGSPILLAEEVDSSYSDGDKESEAESFTWTFYKFSTVKGSVTVRWLGVSNGFYSEKVDYYYSEGA